MLPTCSLERALCLDEHTMFSLHLSSKPCRCMHPHDHFHKRVMLTFDAVWVVKQGFAGLYRQGTPDMLSLG